MDVFCGIDWAEDHHDIALADRDGGLLARARIGDDAAGLARLLELLAEHGDSAENPVPVAIETPRGLLVACLRASRRVYPVNPMAVARYRDRHSVAGRKSDHGDAVVLANILRTDLHAHRPLPADSELAQAIAVLARAQQDAVWDRTQAHNRLRSHPRRRRQADPDPAARPAEESRPPPRHRHRSNPAAGGIPRGADAPAPPGRAGHGPPGPGPAAPARRRLRRRRRPRARRGRVF